MIAGALGVKKGVWTDEEDDVLRKYVQKYGEGKWHQVPGRAGLNRCRKSCRLRWLNYLKPNIKRGEFQEDEVDLMLRLHKLLGNRWSLIAGRLPGRTANDVKNYWNTHYKKKKVFAARKPMYQEKHRPQSMAKVIVIKPHPRAFKKFLWIPAKAATLPVAASAGCRAFCSPPRQTVPDQSQALPMENDTSWLESLLLEKNAIDEEGVGEATALKCSVGSESDDGVPRESWSVELMAVGEDCNGWDQDIFDDTALNCWELLGCSNELVVQ